MKIIRFGYMNKKFDDQFTFELNGYLTRKDFDDSMVKINQVAASRPPIPSIRHFAITSILLIIACATIGSLANLVEPRQWLIFSPIFMFLIIAGSLGNWYWAKVQRNKFEAGIIDICERINATENIRGINYRLSKELYLSEDKIEPEKLRNKKTDYGIVIEFDDRFNIPSIQKYGKFPSEEFVAVPLFTSKGLHSTSPPYSEKEDIV